LRQLSDILGELVPKKGKSKSDVARKLNISSQLLGQYMAGGRKPGGEFYLKWRQVFGEDLLQLIEPKVSHETPSSAFAIVAEGPVDEEYLRKYVKLLEEQLSFYKDKVQLSLADISNKVTIARAEIRAATEYQVMKDAKNNDHKRKELMGVIDMLIGENLQVAGQMGKSARAHT
jgi:transcriptional regulator with XRE-family HTH domain